MTTKAIQRRRGTTAQHSTFTGLNGELTVDTEKKTVVVHDGSTAGGTPLAKAADTVNLTGAQTVAGVKTLSSNPVLDAGTASTALALDASKNVVSVTNTGTGDNVLSNSPTLVTPALGTPASGVVTNLTGTASININGTVGATTASTGAFTTLTASTNLSSTRINPRTSSTASTATLTPDISAFDQYNLTAQAAGLTVEAPTGTPVDGNKLIIRILDNGTPQTITWNATYTVIGPTLPTTTTANKMIYVGCVYNSTNTRWDVIALATQA